MTHIEVADAAVPALTGEVDLGGPLGRLRGSASGDVVRVVLTAAVTVGLIGCGEVDSVVMTDSAGCKYMVRLVRDLNSDGKRLIVDGETLYDATGKPMCGAP